MEVEILKKKSVVSLLTKKKKKAFEYKQQQSIYCTLNEVLMHNSDLIQILHSFQWRVLLLTIDVRKRYCRSGILSAEALVTDLCD